LRGAAIFILDQDLLAGAVAKIGKLIEFIRTVWPRFMRLRVLMVGCAAGEGHLDDPNIMPGCNLTAPARRSMGAISLAPSE